MIVIFNMNNIIIIMTTQVISNSECNNAYGGITDNMLCAADASGNGGSDACQVMMMSMKRMSRMMMSMMRMSRMMTLMMMMTMMMTLMMMMQGDSGGPLVSCGADGNCGTTPGQNYELIGI